MKRFIKRLKMWFSYWKITKKLYDYDYSCVLYAELHHLKILYNGINKYRSHINAERDLQRIKLCIKLLKISTDNFIYADKTLKCNLKNYKRFLPYVKKELLVQYPGELYQQKAWKLYHMIREKYMFQWWD